MAEFRLLELHGDQEDYVYRIENGLISYARLFSKKFSKPFKPYSQDIEANNHYGVIKTIEELLALGFKKCLFFHDLPEPETEYEFYQLGEIALVKEPDGKVFALNGAIKHKMLDVLGDKVSIKKACVYANVSLFPPDLQDYVLPVLEELRKEEFNNLLKKTKTNFKKGLNSWNEFALIERIISVRKEEKLAKNEE